MNGIQEVSGSIPLVSIPEGEPRCVSARLFPVLQLVRGRLLFRRVADKYRRSGCRIYAGIAQLVEHNLAKVGVAGSSPVSRSVVFELRLATAG